MEEDLDVIVVGAGWFGLVAAKVSPLLFSISYPYPPPQKKPLYPSLDINRETDICKWHLT